jgi:hypothetical protein
MCTGSLEEPQIAHQVPLDGHPSCRQPVRILAPAPIVLFQETALLLDVVVLLPLLGSALASKTQGVMFHWREGAE